MLFVERRSFRQVQVITAYLREPIHTLAWSLRRAALSAGEHATKVWDVPDCVVPLVVVVGCRAMHHLPATAARDPLADAPHLDHLVQLGGVQRVIPVEVSR